MERIKSLKESNLYRKEYFIALIALVIVSLVGIAYAAFSDKGEVKGTRVTVGSSDIKLLQDITLGAVAGNFVDELQGPSFENIGQTWTEDYLVKLFNNAPGIVDLTSYAFYETVNDNLDLRQDISVELFDWDDADGDGYVGEGELGASYGKKTIVKWKTEGFVLGQMNSGELKGLIVRFSADGIPVTKQGATMLFDFGFEAVALE